MKHRITEIHIVHGWLYKWSVMVLLVILTVFMGMILVELYWQSSMVKRIGEAVGYNSIIEDANIYNHIAITRSDKDVIDLR